MNNPNHKLLEKPSLKIEGRSGCKMEILEEEHRYFVKKFSSAPAYNDRLKRQKLKQEEFEAQLKGIRWFMTPSVLEEGKDGNSDLYWFKMDYMSGEKATEYLANCDRNSIKSLIQKFKYYLDTLVQNSELREPPVQAIREKIGSLSKALHEKSNLSQSVIDSTIDYLSNKIPSVKIPLGYCHGDFTLSNMLFGLYNIYLFDFLDSFIESPLIDIVKLRQDTRYYWSFLIDKNISKEQENKARIALHYIDNTLKDYIEKNENFQNWYNYLELFNFARILPYLSNKTEIDFVEGNITKLLKNK